MIGNFRRPLSVTSSAQLFWKVTATTMVIHTIHKQNIMRKWSVGGRMLTAIKEYCVGCDRTSEGISDTAPWRLRLRGLRHLCSAVVVSRFSLTTHLPHPTQGRCTKCHKTKWSPNFQKMEVTRHPRQFLFIFANWASSTCNYIPVHSQMDLFPIRRLINQWVSAFLPCCSPLIIFSIGTTCLYFRHTRQATSLSSSSLYLEWMLHRSFTSYSNFDVNGSSIAG